MKWTDENNPEDATTESLEKRDKQIQENGVVEDKDWNAMVFGACLFFGLIVILINIFL